MQNVLVSIFGLSVASFVVAAGVYLVNKSARQAANKAIVWSGVAFLVSSIPLAMIAKDNDRGKTPSNLAIDDEAVHRSAGFTGRIDRETALKYGYSDAREWAAVRKELARAEERACMQELKCAADKMIIDATATCRPLIERLAKGNFEWTDGWLEPKLSHYKWRSESRDVITYAGDKIKFQNGFGAWAFHTYFCDFDIATERAVNVRVTPGRLPPN